MARLTEFAERLAFIQNKSLDFEVIEVMKSHILGQRALWLRREHERNGHFPIEAIFTDCFELEKSNIIECCGEDLKYIKCHILRTKVEFPEMIAIKHGAPFITVYNGNSTLAYNYLNLQRVGINFPRFKTTYHNFYTYKNNRIYLLSTLVPEFISVSCVPVNRLDFAKLTNCKGNTCIDIKNDMIIEGHLEELIENSILNKYRQNIESNEIKVNEN